MPRIPHAPDPVRVLQLSERVFVRTDSIPPTTGTRRFPLPTTLAPFINPSFQNGQSVSSILPGTSRMPQILTWTFSIQREIARNLAFEATYIGSHSTHLVVGSQLSNMNTLPLAISLWAIFCCSRSLPRRRKRRASDFRIRTSSTSPPSQLANRFGPYPQYLDVTEEWGPHGIARFNSCK